MSCGCKRGVLRTRSTGGVRLDKGRRSRLRYKISAGRKPLKSRTILNTCRKLRYKISFWTNRLF